MKKPRTKMPIEQRAKQFAPFKSLNGLDDVLRQAEEEHRRMMETSGVVNISAEEAETSGESSI